VNSIREKILDNIKSTLEDIKASKGYYNTVASVQRWSQHGNNLVDVPCIIISSGPETKKPEPNPLYTCRWTVFIDAITRHDESSTEPTDRLINKMIADVEKALMVDITRGGYAMDTNLVNNVPFEAVEGQPNVGAVIEIDIVYQHKQSDPEEQL